MSSHGWHIVGYGVAGLFTLLGLFGMATGVLGLTGHNTGKVRFECDRAKAECRSVHPLRTKTYALGDVTGAEVKSKQKALGRGGRFETAYALTLNLRDTNDPATLSEWTADEESVAKFRDAASQIQTFLGGNQPTLSITFGTKESWVSNWGAILGSVLVFAVAAAIIYFIRRGR